MNILVEIDLAQAEWIVTAFCSQDPHMLEVVEEKLDPHLRTGHLISKAPEEFILLEYSLVKHNTDPVEIARLRKALPEEWEGAPVRNFFLPRTMSIRQAGKKSNHGLNYNMQYRRFALENGLEESDAKRICHLYRNVAYPGLKEYYRWVEHMLHRDNRRLTNCYGQSLKFMDRWGPELLDSAYSFLPQSTVGNITAFAWRKIYEDEARLERIQLRAQVHDSIMTQNTCETPEELAEQITICADYMAIPFQYHEREHTIDREVKIGFDWGDEGMIEVVLGKDGRAVPEVVKESIELARAASIR